MDAMTVGLMEWMEMDARALHSIEWTKWTVDMEWIATLQLDTPCTKFQPNCRHYNAAVDPIPYGENQSSENYRVVVEPVDNKFILLQQKIGI